MTDEQVAISADQPRISRVVMAYREENFDKAVQDFTSALGISFEILDTRHLGLRVAMSLSAGMEIIAPDGDGGYAPMTRQALERQGEGLQQVILQVPDLEAGAAMARKAGWDSQGFRIDCFDANPAWRKDYASMREAPLPPINNVSVTLIAMVPHG